MAISGVNWFGKGPGDDSKIDDKILDDKKATDDDKKTDKTDEDDLDTTGFWDDPKDNKDDDKTTRIVLEQPKEPVKADEVINNHIESLQLTADFDMDTIGAEFAEGKTEAFDKGLSEYTKKIYGTLLKDASTLINKQVADGIAKAVKAAGTNSDAKEAIKQMNKRMAFTQNAEVAPMANAALVKALEKSDSVEQAISSVQKLFRTMFKASAKDLGLGSPAPTPGSDGFSNSLVPSDFGNGDDENKDTNWMDVLAPKN